MRLALADALDLGGVQRIDFSAALVLALLTHPFGQPQGLPENVAQDGVGPDPAGDVALDAAQNRAQLAQLPPGALELFGVGVALIGDQRIFADPFIGLAQDDAMLFGQTHQLFARPMHQPGVGGMRDGLGLHGGVDDHLGEVRRLGRAGFGGDRKALLDQRSQPLLAHALAPARHRRTVEGRLVAEELLAAEEREIGVLDPAVAQGLVGEIVHVLEDRQTRHQAGRQRRLAPFIGIDRAEPLLQKAPVDGSRQFDQRMGHIEDLVEPRPEKIVLPAVSTFLRPHRESPNRVLCDSESRPAAPINLHVWMPPLEQEVFGRRGRVIGCGHVSGLFARPVEVAGRYGDARAWRRSRKRAVGLVAN